MLLLWVLELLLLLVLLRWVVARKRGCGRRFRAAVAAAVRQNGRRRIEARLTSRATTNRLAARREKVGHGLKKTGECSLRMSSVVMVQQRARKQDK